MNLKNLMKSVLLTAFLVFTTSMLSFGQIYVNNTNGDDLVGTGSQISPYKTLAGAVSVAAAGSTIYIAADVYPEAHLTIGKALL